MGEQKRGWGSKVSPRLNEYVRENVRYCGYDKSSGDERIDIEYKVCEIYHHRMDEVRTNTQCGISHVRASPPRPQKCMLLTS